MENKIKHCCCLFFIIVVVVGLSNSITSILNYYRGNDISLNGFWKDFTYVNIEKQITDGLWVKHQLIDLNGTITKAFNIRDYYSSRGIFIADDNYLISSSNYTSTDYEYDQIISFKNFLDENNIKLLYVNKPIKYDNDDLFNEEFMIESYTNRNADRFIKRIEDAGIECLDLRDIISSENKNISDLFYRTDHHWTTYAGLWAAENISNKLNSSFDYDIDLTKFDYSEYQNTTWNNCWLGEQGKVIGKTYVGLDDYSELKPKFETDYTFFKNGEKISEGTFDFFIDAQRRNVQDVYESKSWHYSYLQRDCQNNKVDQGNILLVGDSYDQVTEPFLSLGVHRIDSLILRDTDDGFSLRDYIIKNKYDTVIICYAEFMIGAHDNRESSNYRMFDFD